MLDVNALGTMNGTIAALEKMLPPGRGHVINVISLAGLVAAPGEVNYSASKHAAMAFTLGTLFDLRRAGVTGVRGLGRLPGRHLDADARGQTRRPGGGGLLLRPAAHPGARWQSRSAS